jgi:uncharacterized membrane protein
MPKVQFLHRPHQTIREVSIQESTIMPFFSHPSTRVLVGRALLAGVSAGLRSMTPIGVLASQHDDNSIRAGWKNWPVLRSALGRKALQVSWVGELIADKLPVVPPRTEPGPLGGRMLIGALAGAAIGTEAKGTAPRMASALAGIAGAVAGSYGGNRARTYLTKEVGLPDMPGALVGDATAMVLARKAVRG